MDVKLDFGSKACIFMIVVLSIFTTLYIEYEAQEDKFQNDILESSREINQYIHDLEYIDNAIKALHLSSESVTQAELAIFFDSIKEKTNLEATLVNTPVDSMRTLKVDTDVYISIEPISLRLFEQCHGFFVTRGMCIEKTEPSLKSMSYSSKIESHDQDYVFHSSFKITSLFYLKAVITLLLSFTILTIFKTMDYHKKASIKYKHQAKIKSDILATLSHEIKTPLNAILFYASKFTDSENAKKIVSASSLLEHTIDNIIITNKTKHVMKSSVQIKHVTKDLNDMFSYLFEMKGLSIKFSIENGVLDTDRLMLKRIVNNITSNAYKYTKTGGLNIFGTSTNGNYELKFVDTGIGISKKNLDKIFDSYVQINEKSSGIGLGLAIVKDLCNQLAIGLKIESELDKGTAITLTIPRKIDTATHDNNKQATYQIMAVDDDIFNREIYRAIASENRLPMIIASSSEEAIQLAEIHQPYIFFVDINLGEESMDGWQLGILLRKKSKLSNLKIYAVTASSIQEQDLPMDFDGYIAKPFTTREILDRSSLVTIS